MLCSSQLYLQILFVIISDHLVSTYIQKACIHAGYCKHWKPVKLYVNLLTFSCTLVFCRDLDFKDGMK